MRETEWEAAQSVWLWRDPSGSMDYTSAGYIAGAEWPTKRDRSRGFRWVVLGADRLDQ